jgi:hypothetical protein
MSIKARILFYRSSGDQMVGLRRARLSIGTLLFSVAMVAIAAMTGAAPVGATAASGGHISWGSHRLTLRAGQELTLRLERPNVGLCSLAVGGPRHAARQWTYRAGKGLMRVALHPTSDTQAGRWTIAAACVPTGTTNRQTISTIVLIVNKAAARGGLVGSHGPAVSLPLIEPPFGIGRGGAGNGNPFQQGECTYWGYQNRPDIYETSVADGAPAGGPIPNDPHGRMWWDAFDWAKMASEYGHFPEGTTPEVGAIWVEAPGPQNDYYGHVTYVTSVISSTTFLDSEMNTNGELDGPHYNMRRTVSAGSVFIYQLPAPSQSAPPNPDQYVGTIVQWNGDTKAQKTAWLVGDDLHRRWIPTIAVYQCLKAQGVPGPVALSSSVLNELPDLTNEWATCADAGGGAGGGAGPTPTSSPPPTPTPAPTTAPTTAPTPAPTPAPNSRGTYSETVGGVTHTWTDYTDAGGTEGSSIAAFQTVQVTCAVEGFQVADGDTWWYEIASDPWDNNYYASADAFYNNGQTSGSLHGTPFVDPAVPVC